MIFLNDSHTVVVFLYDIWNWFKLYPESRIPSVCFIGVSIHV